MKDIILKPGSFLEDKKNSHTGKIPGQSLEDFVVGVMKSATCCTKILKNNGCSRGAGDGKKKI